MQIWQRIYIFASILFISLKKLKKKIKRDDLKLKQDLCKVCVLRKLIKPPLLDILEVAENSKMIILFLPLISVPNHPFLRAESLWSLSLDTVISAAATDSPVS